MADGKSVRPHEADHLGEKFDVNADKFTVTIFVWQGHNREAVLQETEFAETLINIR